MLYQLHDITDGRVHGARELVAQGEFDGPAEAKAWECEFRIRRRWTWKRDFELVDEHSEYFFLEPVEEQHG